jgi:hypothetical protein
MNPQDIKAGGYYLAHKRQHMIAIHVNSIDSWEGSFPWTKTQEMDTYSINN